MAHVLIVDDDVALLQALPEALSLRMHGVSVDTCDSAPAALDRIAATDYDAIVSDIKMPGTDGLALLAEIRALRPDTPTLLITGHGEHDLAVQALRGGAYDFIQKPIDRDYFVASLSRALRMRELDRQVEQQKLALERHANELEQTVRERTRELEEANQAKDQLLVREQEARAEAELAQRRSAFLAEASTLLTASLDYPTTLASLACLAVPYLADWCVVDVADEGGAIRRLAMAHVDPAKVEMARDLGRRYPPDPNAPHGVPNVLRTGQPEMYPEIPDSLLATVARDAEHLRILRALGLRSAMVVPLVARGRTLGALTFVSAESGRRYGPAELALAEDLARRAALAVDNARLYAAAERERVHLEEANRAKDEFLATVSHELRTPLTAILGWTQLLRRGNLDQAGQARALERLESNAKSQAQVIEDLLDVSRIVAGKLRLAVRPLDLVPIVEAALDGVRPAAAAKAIRLEAALDPTAGSVSGDADRLQQVVWNLLTNAIKFTPREGRVQVRLARVDSQVELTVRDTGQGIHPDFLPYVFERFRQADSTSTRSHGGLGLGLAIVRHLVELHGGTVQAASEGEGCGATFTVRLPVAAVRAEPREVGRVPSAARDGLPRGGTPTLEGLRVLVVDDEAEARELLTALLEEYGAAVTAVGSAAEALAALERERPDVLVSDIGMPGQDGYELIREVRARGAERGGEIPAAALTAYASAEDRTRALAAGYQVHVPKPVEAAQLAAVVARLAGPAERV